MTATHYQSACEGKIPFLSYAAAHRAGRRNGSAAYRCRACGSWHVGGGRIGRRTNSLRQIRSHGKRVTA